MVDVSGSRLRNVTNQLDDYCCISWIDGDVPSVVTQSSFGSLKVETKERQRR